MSNYQSQIEELSENLSRLDDEISALEKISAHHPQIAAYTQPALAALRRLRQQAKKLRDVAIDERQKRLI